MLRGTNFCSCSVKSKVLWNYVRFLFWIFKKHASKKAKFYENKPFCFQSWFFLIPSRHSPFYVLLNTFFVFMGYGKETSDWSECMSIRGLGDQLFLKKLFWCHNVCPVTAEYKHLAIQLYLQMVASHVQIGTFPGSHYLKSGKFCT